MPLYLQLGPSCSKLTPTVTFTLAPISLIPSSPLNGIMTSKTENYSQLFSPLLNGANMFRGCHTPSPSSPTTKTCPTSKTRANFLVNKVSGLFSYRTSMSSGRYSLVQNSPLLTLFPTILKLIPPPIMTTPLLFLNLQLSTPSISPSPDTSNRLHPLIPLYFMPFRTCLMIPLSSHVPLSPTGLSTMDTSTIKVECIYHRPLDPLSFTPSIPRPSRATSDIFIPRPLLNVIFGGQGFLYLSTTLLLVVLFASRTKLAHTLYPLCSHPLSPPPHCPLSNSLSISSPTYPFLMDMIP